jgi:hypothetical protein
MRSLYLQILNQYQLKGISFYVTITLIDFIFRRDEFISYNYANKNLQALLSIISTMFFF